MPTAVYIYLSKTAEVDTSQILENAHYCIATVFFPDSFLKLYLCSMALCHDPLMACDMVYVCSGIDGICAKQAC